MELKANAFQEAKPILTPDDEKVITVETRDNGVTLDGKQIPGGMTVKVSVKQWRALSRHLKWIDGPKEHDPKNDTFIKQAQKTAAKALAAIALLLTLFCAPKARALTNSLSAPSSYGAISTVLASNGLPPNTVITNFVSSSGLNCVSLTLFDSCDWEYGFNPITNLAGTTGITNYLLFYFGGSGTNFGTNQTPNIIWTNVCGPGSNSYVGNTNFNNLILGSAGYVYIVESNASSGVGQVTSTNVYLRPYAKPTRSGR